MANPEIDFNGNTFYHNKKGKIHRVRGPAIIYKNGDEFWLRNGSFHRTDGPAVNYYENKGKMWYLDGVLYSYFEYLKEVTKYISKEKLFLIRLKYG